MTNIHFAAIETNLCNERHMLCHTAKLVGMLARRIDDECRCLHDIADALENFDEETGGGNYSVAQLDSCTLLLVDRGTGFVVLQVKGVR